MTYRSRILAVALVTLVVLMVAGPVSFVQAATDTIGDTSSSQSGEQNWAQAVPITASASGTLQTVGVNIQTAAGNLRVAIYADSSGAPGALLGQSSSVAAVTGWNDVSVTSVTITASTKYWVAVNCDSASLSVYVKFGQPPQSLAYRAWSYGAFPNPFGSPTYTSQTYNMRITYSTGPPASDFTITATTPSQTVGAGATATYTLQITYSATLTATANLAVTSGCPAGVTCMVSPSSVTGSNPVTLSVPTLVTTPGGTTTVTVTASSTSPALSHSVSVQLTVNSPGSYGVTVHSGATQVVVTVSWAGSGAAAVTLAGPGGSPTLSESAAVVYDRVTYVSGSSSPNNIHRVTFTITAPPSAQAWTVLVSLSGSYTVTIEVS